MSGTGVSITQVDRVAGLVYDAIVDSTEKLLVADGVATCTVFDVPGTPRIDLTSAACVATGGAGSLPEPATRRLPDEIRQLAPVVQRALVAKHHLVESVRQITIDIQLRGPRPGFEISYRGHKA